MKWFLLLLCATLCAYEPIAFRWCGGETYGGAEALYWRPTDCGSFDWGIRGFAGYKSDCYEGRASYLYYKSYQAADLRGQAILHQTSRATLAGYANLRWAQFKRGDARSWSMGLGVGSEAALLFCNAFTIKGNVGLLGLLGEQTNPNCSTLIPAFEMRFGMGYTMRCSFLSATVEAAYEVVDYLQAIRQANGCHDLGFGGLVISLSLAY